MAPWKQLVRDHKFRNSGVPYLRLLDFNAFHALESVEEGESTLVQTLGDTVVLLVVQLEARLALEG
jgi:hypothetical protein